MKKYTQINKFDAENQTTVYDDICIDERKLKENWLKQAQLHTEYGFIASEIKKERDLLARKVKVKHSELNLDIRKVPHKYIPELLKKEKGFRLTESIVESAIESDKEYQKLNRLCVQKDYEFSMYKNIIDALNDKRKALEQIQELIIGSFYAEPSDSKIRKLLNK